MYLEKFIYEVLEEHLIYKGCARTEKLKLKPIEFSNNAFLFPL